MDHNMVLSYDYAKRYRQWRWTNAPPLRAISMAMVRRWSTTCGDAQCSMSRATPEATGCRHQVTTCSVSPRRPPGRQSTQWLWNMYPLCWPFRWPSQCSGTISRASPDGGGLWLSLKQLNATIGRALTPIASNRTRQLRLFRTFHREKELQLTCWPLITIGVWHIKLTRST